jgi:hypothetical protein
MTFKSFPPSGNPGFNRADVYLHRFRDFFVRQSLDIAHHHRNPLLDRQLEKQSLNFRTLFLL